MLMCVGPIMLLHAALRSSTHCYCNDKPPQPQYGSLLHFNSHHKPIRHHHTYCTWSYWVKLLKSSPKPCKDSSLSGSFLYASRVVIQCEGGCKCYSSTLESDAFLHSKSFKSTLEKHSYTEKAWKNHFKTIVCIFHALKKENLITLLIQMTESKE